MENEFDDLEPQQPKGARILLILILLAALAAAAGLILMLRDRAAPAREPDPAVPPGGILELDALAAEDGDSLLLVSPNGKTMLVNAGTARSAPGIVRELESRGIGRIDVLVLNDPEPEAAEGMREVLESVPAGELWVSPLWTEGPVRELAALAEEKGVPVRTPYGSAVSLTDWDSDAEVRILSPYEASYPRTGDAALVLRVLYGNTAVLISGGISELTERLIVKALPDHLLHASILTVSPYAGENPASGKFLKAVRPLTVLCTGTDADPGKAFEERVARSGAELVVPETGKTVRFFLDGVEVRMIE